MKRQTDPDVLLLQALADPTRLDIVRRLALEPAVCACEFGVGLGVSQPTVSHHLRVLRESGWVGSERRGTWVWYSLRPEAADRLRRLSELVSPSPLVAGGTATRDVPGLGGRRLRVIQPEA